jgi:hypothetical protein
MSNNSPPFRECSRRRHLDTAPICED